MTVAELIGTGEFCSCTAASPDKQISGVYSGDLLSDIIAHAGCGDVLVTVMAHENTLAVAKLLGLSAVILTKTSSPPSALAETAARHEINLLFTEKSTFDASVILYGLLKGR